MGVHRYMGGRYRAKDNVGVLRWPLCRGALARVGAVERRAMHRGVLRAFVGWWWCWLSGGVRASACGCVRAYACVRVRACMVGGIRCSTPFGPITITTSAATACACACARACGKRATCQVVALRYLMLPVVPCTRSCHSSRGESGWCLDWTSVPGVWRHTVVRFHLRGDYARV